jgi:hypothetical protein
MSDIRTAIYRLLSNEGSITSYVGTQPVRIWRSRLPQNPDFESVVMHVPETDPDHVQAGQSTSAGPSGLVDCLLVLDGYSLSQTTAVSLMKAVEAILSGYSGTINGVEIQGVFLRREGDYYEPVIKAYRVSQAYQVWFYV